MNTGIINIWNQPIYYFLSFKMIKTLIGFMTKLKQNKKHTHENYDDVVEFLKHLYDFVQYINYSNIYKSIDDKTLDDAYPYIAFQTDYKLNFKNKCELDMCKMNILNDKLMFLVNENKSGKFEIEYLYSKLAFYKNPYHSILNSHCFNFSEIKENFMDRFLDFNIDNNTFYISDFGIEYLNKIHNILKILKNEINESDDKINDIIWDGTNIGDIEEYYNVKLNTFVKIKYSYYINFNSINKLFNPDSYKNEYLKNRVAIMNIVEV